MKRSSKALIAALGIALAGSAMAYSRDDYFDYARVDRVDRLVAADARPATERECWTQPRKEYHPGTQYHREYVDPAYDDDDDAPTVIRDDVVETGGYTTTREERMCQTRTARVRSSDVLGYDVVYTYRGQDYHERLDHDPGRSVRVHVDHGYVEVAE